MDKPNFLRNFNPEKERDHIVASLRDWFDKNDPSHTKNAVIGISGGKDSTIAAALLARAIGPDRVLGVMLPDVQQDDINDSVEVIQALKIRGLYLNIGPITSAIYANISSAVIKAMVNDGDDADYEMSKDSVINTPPRVRMTVLRNLAQSAYGNGFLINTCNRSEEHIGYSTKDGDGTGDISPLGAYTVSEIVAIGMTMYEIPEHLVIKTPADGLCGQTDEDRFGFTYETLDRYLLTEDWLQQTSNTKREESNLPQMKLIAAMHRESEHKRRPMPVIPKLCDTYLSRPFSKEKILDTLATQDHPFMSGVVGIDMSDIFTDRWDYNYDAFMDELSMRLTDTDKLTHIKYKIKSYDEDTNQLLIWVEGDVSKCYPGE